MIPNEASTKFIPLSCLVGLVPQGLKASAISCVSENLAWAWSWLLKTEGDGVHPGSLPLAPGRSWQMLPTNAPALFVCLGYSFIAWERCKMSLSGFGQSSHSNFAVAGGWSRSRCWVCAGAAFIVGDTGSWVMPTLDLYPLSSGFLFWLNLLL